MADFKLNGRGEGSKVFDSPLVFAAVGVVIRNDDTSVLDSLYEFAGIPREQNLDEDVWAEEFDATYRFLKILPVGVFDEDFDDSGNCHIVYIRHTYQDMNPTYRWAEPDSVAGAFEFPVIDTTTNAYKQLIQFCDDYGITKTPGVVMGNCIH